MSQAADHFARGDWQDDAAQRAVLVELDRIGEQLRRAKPEGLFARLRARFSTPAPVRGLYLWGGVGRGKTFLIDLFYEHLPIAQKRRVHYHRFMRTVQARLKDLLNELAQALGPGAEAMMPHILQAVRQLIEQGFLLPPAVES